MSILFSRQCEYALQSVLYLALSPPGERVSIKELTKRLDIPYHFLGKILQRLTNRKLLTSSKGPTGGFALAKKANEITLFDIIDAIDGSEFARNCVMGFAECSAKHPCAIHSTWGPMRDRIHAMLVSQSIAEMAQQMKKPEYRHKR